MQCTRVVCAAGRLAPRFTIRTATLATVNSARAHPVRANERTGLFSSLLGFGKKQAAPAPAPAPVESTPAPVAAERPVSRRARRSGMDLKERMEFVVRRDLPQALEAGWEAYPLDNHFVKFRLLRAFEEEFRREIPNGQLHTLKTIGDVTALLACPHADTPAPTFPSVDLKALPPNLSIQR